MIQSVLKPLGASKSTLEHVAAFVHSLEIIFVGCQLDGFAECQIRLREPQDRDGVIQLGKNHVLDRTAA